MSEDRLRSFDSETSFLEREEATNKRLAALEHHPVLDEEDFAARARAYMAIEGERVSDISIQRTYDQSYAILATLMSNDRQKAARRLEVAQQIEPYVEDGCERVITRMCPRFVGKKTLRMCGANIPTELLKAQRSLVDPYSNGL
jgi:hypothetical protein